MTELVLEPLPWRYSVYVIGYSDKPVKVGYARNVTKRVAMLQTGTPKQLYVFAEANRLTREEARAIERATHEKLKDKHLRGEWFDIDCLEAEEVVQSFINTRVYSARMLSSFDLRGLIEPDKWNTSLLIARKDITNGCQIQT